jgi:hypothetical protein
MNDQRNRRRQQAALWLLRQQELLGVPQVDDDMELDDSI